MIPELGHFALILALVLALVQGTLPLVGAARGRVDWMEVARPAAFLQCAAGKPERRGGFNFALGHRT